MRKRCYEKREKEKKSKKERVKQSQERTWRGRKEKGDAEGLFSHF